MAKTPFSVTIITLNEADHIAACIASLDGVTDDVVVLDSNSSDDTCAIAEAAGARVVRQAFLGDGPQKNEAAAHARHDWVFSLDADERFTPELVAVLRELDLDGGGHDGYAIRRRNHVGSRWVKHGGWYPDRITRLYNRKRIAYNPVFVHAKVVGGSVHALDADILHYSFDSIADVLSNASSHHSAHLAYDLYQSGHRNGIFKPVSRALWSFLWSYFVRMGFLGRADGFTIAVSMFLRAYGKYAIVDELHRDPAVRAQFDELYARSYAQTRARAAAGGGN